jgi:UDP-N-acetylmuramyl tripeptide synthase
MGGSGSAAPGLAVEKLSPKFLPAMLAKLPHGVILVTGTNGKTTTTKVISELLEAQGLRVLTNKTGSNFVRGIVTAVVDKASLGGKLPYDIAVFEQDEAHAVHFVHQVKPRGIVVLNIMRDQLDRFGEIDATARLLQKVVGGASSWVLLNANDERVSQLKPAKGVKTEWFGHVAELQSSFLTDDELHHHDNTAYIRAADTLADLAAYDEKTVSVKVNGHVHVYETPLDGSHNAINITAALAVLRLICPDASNETITKSMAALQPAFGRGEVITLDGGGQITLQLVKNPGGFTHALRLLNLKSYGFTAIAINDDYADGRDVSWLWDVDFAVLKSSNVLTGGTRGYDMAVRLKYDEIKLVEPQLPIDQFVVAVNAGMPEENKTAIIFCTYTAMLKIRAEYRHYSKDVSGAIA